MNITRLWPGGKPRAFNITYDDGVLQDARFVALLNRYGIPGTFNLNSQLMAEGFVWTHETGMPVKRLPLSAARDLYEGHEVASHTLTHPDFKGLARAEVLRQMREDKAALEAAVGRPVLGFGVPFDYYDEGAAQCARQAGFAYGRCGAETDGYAPDLDYYNWRCGLFHLSPLLDSYIEGFFACREELALCQLVGHSYDLDVAGLWGRMESILARMAADDTVWCATHLEIVQYLKASRAAIVQPAYIHNNSGRALWFSVDGQPLCLAPGVRWQRETQK